MLKLNAFCGFLVTGKPSRSSMHSDIITFSNCIRCDSFDPSLSTIDVYAWADLPGSRREDDVPEVAVSLHNSRRLHTSPSTRVYSLPKRAYTH